MNEEIQNILHREGIHLASNKKRAMAFFIDDMLITMVLMLSFSDVFGTDLNIEQFIKVVQSVLFEIILIKIFYQTFFVMQYGATIGKIIMKIRVIEINTLQNPNILVALNRAIFRIISHILYGLGFVWGLLNPERQTWHDKTARTLVVDA